MKIYPLHQAQEVFREEDSTGMLVAKTDLADVVLLTLAPGSTLPEHSLGMSVLFTIASGSATLLTNGERQSLTAGDVVQIDPNDLRGWENETDSECRIFAIKMVHL